MRFGKTLRNSIYEPWKDDYIEYSKLKWLLREDETADANGGKWTDDDEGRFVEELVNVQLEKVNSFQVDTYKQLRERTAKCESRLEVIVVSKSKEQHSPGETKLEKDDKDSTLQEIEKELDSISKDINELEKYSRINYTGFLKAAKKHDRRRGSNYRVRPLLQVRLAALPFNSEDYSPLLYRLSAMYSYIRSNLSRGTERSQSVSESKNGGDRYTSHKFFIHPDNLLEVKTYILRRLPVLVYNPNTSKVVEGSQQDPTITSLYFDNPKFSLYTRKVEKAGGASSLRLRWFGQLAEKPELLFEKKTIGDSDDSEEIRFSIKEKYVKPFVNGDYKMQKSVQKLQERQGNTSEEVTGFEKTVNEIQSFIKEYHLQPVLRANYTRTAFQIPGDDRIRISIDTNLVVIREDSLDIDRPCRDPEDWHRVDIDSAEMEFPFTGIKKGEISRFPYAVLEIKVRNDAKKKSTEWVEELMSSHLVRDAPRFSKFIHGVASLFEDYINTFPFWLSFLETDIRKDPEVAFQEEQDKKAKRAADEHAVGSFMGGKSASSFKPATASPSGKVAAFPPNEVLVDGNRQISEARKANRDMDDVVEEHDSDGYSARPDREIIGMHSGLRSLFPSFSTSKYARRHRESTVKLPPGVQEPETWIKDAGPVRVEPKVWLANQRTFIKWMHVSVLLASLSLSLYNGAGKSNDIARALGVAYTLIAVFAGAWGWWMYIRRSRMIEQRSGKDFDNVLGPIVVCLGLVVALCLNFGFKYKSATSHANTEVWHGYTDPYLPQIDTALTQLFDQTIRLGNRHHKT
ncbi:Phosphate metabolism transcription protein [Xylographa opegraphella]|nr:Phosphate metabolism transcription protein [Xylographa opegraphella]